MFTQNDEEAVRDCNARFYRALREYDGTGMERIWAHEPWVACVHPGWDIVSGWTEVKASWDAIFRSSSRLEITIGGVQVRVLGDSAWVLCAENIMMTSDEGFFRSRAQATNLFVRREGGWRMVHHHSSPVADGGVGVLNQTIQ